MGHLYYLPTFRTPSLFSPLLFMNNTFWWVTYSEWMIPSETILTTWRYFLGRQINFSGVTIDWVHNEAMNWLESAGEHASDIPSHSLVEKWIIFSLNRVKDDIPIPWSIDIGDEVRIYHLQLCADHYDSYSYTCWFRSAVINLWVEIIWGGLISDIFHIKYLHYNS